MPGSVLAFTPIAPTLALSASTSSASASFAGTADSAVIYNATSATAFVATGAGSATANNGGYPVPPGQRAMVGLSALENAVAVVLASGTGTVYVTVGTGTEY